MSKNTPKSYFDWQLSFRRNPHSKRENDTPNKNKEVNDGEIIEHLGISRKTLKEFLKDWREKNL